MRYIEKGRVRLAHTTRGGNCAICGLVASGAFLGEDVLSGYPVRRQTAVAIIATQVIAVARAPMIRLLHAQQPIADRFIAHILARHSHLEADLADQLLHPAEQRWRAPCSCSPGAASEVCADARCLTSLKRSSRKWSARRARA